MTALSFCGHTLRFDIKTGHKLYQLLYSLLNLLTNMWHRPVDYHGTVYNSLQYSIDPCAFLYKLWYMTYNSFCRCQKKRLLLKKSLGIYSFWILFQASSFFLPLKYYRPLLLIIKSGRWAQITKLLQNT